MKHTFLLLLALTLSGCGFFKSLIPPAQAEPPAEDKVNVVARAVAQTIALQVDGRVFCSGVAAEGVFMTAHHCIEDGVAFQILYQNKVYPGAVTLVWAEADLAFVDAIGARVKDTIPMTDWEPDFGHRVIWLGYPLGMELMMGAGIVGNPSVPSPWEEETQNMLLVHGSFLPGNSGGPVFDQMGRLIGLVSGTTTMMGVPVPRGYVVPTSAITQSLETTSAKE